MRKIGLIGGMSFEGSAVYYRLINESVNQRLGGLNAAELLLHSVNFQDIVDLQKSAQWDVAGERLAAVARSLEAAGADCVMICAVTMHLVADAVEQATTLPFIHIVDEVARVMHAREVRSPLLIATRYTMENGFYPTRMGRHDIDVMVPEEDDRIEVHRIIFEELSKGAVLDTSRDFLLGLIKKAKARGADSVILGCTELCMILDPDALVVPGFDSTAIHARAAVDFALQDQPRPDSTR